MKRRSGQGTVEFVLVAPLFAALVFISVQFFWEVGRALKMRFADLEEARLKETTVETYSNEVISGGDDPLK